MEKYAEYLGIKEENTEDKSLCCSITVSEHHLNGHGTVHGGFLYSLCAQAVFVYMMRIGRNGVGMDGNIHYYRPANAGDTLYAYVSERKVGKKTGNFLIELKNQDGKLVVDTMLEAMFLDTIAAC